MMNRDNSLLCALAAAGFFACRASNALRFNFRPVDPIREMNTRQAFPSPSNPCSWAPWQAFQGLKHKASRSNDFDDLEKSSKIQSREEDKPVAAVTPLVDVTPRNPSIKAYIKLLRPQNIPSSFGLVAAGALVGSHRIGSLFDYKVEVSAAALETDVIEDLMGDQTTAKGGADDGKSPDVNESGHPMQLSEKQETSRHPPYLTVVQQFGDTERLAQHGSLREGSLFLSQARMAWLVADERQKTKQTDRPPSSFLLDHFPMP